MMWQRICARDEPTEGQACEFTLEGADGEQAGFLVRYQGELHAYLNSCPHTGMPLNWQPAQFFSTEGDLLECALHGALFRVTDGHCLRGPCVGDALTPLTLRIDEEGVWVPAYCGET